MDAGQGSASEAWTGAAAAARDGLAGQPEAASEVRTAAPARRSGPVEDTFPLEAVLGALARVRRTKRGAPGRASEAAIAVRAFGAARFDGPAAEE